MRAFLLALIFLSLSAQAFAQSKTKPVEPPAPKPVLPSPLPQLPPTLAEQTLPFPLEFIDRPYTPPDDLNELVLRGSATSLNSDANDILFPYYLLDFKYRQSLTSDFALIWNPLPFGIQHQPKRTDTTLTGVSWSVGWQYQGNLGVLPQFSSFLRYKPNPKDAVEMELSYWTFVPFAKAGSVWTGSFRIGPIFQQSRRFAISPRLHVVLDNIRLEMLYGEKRVRIEDKLLNVEKAQVHLPFSLWMGWALQPKFDVTFEYSLIGTGLGSGHYAQLATLGTNLRW